MTQKQALELLKMGKNVFITGPAGSGKTYLVNQYIAYLRENNIDIGITASTGVAATHLGGITIHAWSGIGIRSELSDYDLEALEEKQYLWKRLEKVKVLIIDEVSMLHHFRLDMVDKIMRSFKRNNLPFGGIQLILCGDFFQLPPISRGDEEPAQFIYEASSWRDAGLTICYLSEQFRQKDDVALTILNQIRTNTFSEDSRNHLRARYKKKTLAHVEPTKLFTHNVDVDSLNNQELEGIQGEYTQYIMEAKGRENLVEVLKKSCLAPEVIRLKVGARVMCVKNNFDAGYVNGTLGVVVKCDPYEDPVIRTAKGEEIVIERASWKIEEDGKTKAELIQYPLRLAWAITVHKSQGMSLDAVEVDLSKSFEPGMGYVALSRVRTIEGLTLLGLNDMALQVHPEVFEFDKQLQEQSLIAEEDFEAMKKADIKKIQEEFLARNKSKGKEAKLSTFEETLLLIKDQKGIEEMATLRDLTKETIISHIEALIKENADMDISYLKKEISPSHFRQIEKACEEVLAESHEIKLSPVKAKVGANVSYLEIRLARALLGLI